MDIPKLSSYFSHHIKTKQVPHSVIRILKRETYLLALEAVGKDRSEFTQFSDEDLSEFYKATLGSQYTILQPSPFILISCYAEIFKGITKYKAVRFRATEGSLQMLNEDKVIVDQINNALHLSAGMDYRLALYFIGAADEVLRSFISEFYWNREITEIGFGLSRNQVEQFIEAVNSQ